MHFRFCFLGAFLETLAQATEQLTESRAGLRILGRCSVPATSKPLPEFLAFLRRHLFPPFPHALSHSLGHAFSQAMAQVPFSASGSSPSAKQNPAKKQQSERLPEGNEAPAE